MRTHILCFDGTGQQKTQPYPTNIAHMFDAVGGEVSEGGEGSFEATTQGLTAKYFPGVGTWGNPLLRVLADGFGDGIAEPIVRGYTFLSRQHAPGDRIVLTGFSRGATAARALASFVAAKGLLDPSRFDVSDKIGAYARAIVAWYAYRSLHPDLADQTRPDFIAQVANVVLPPLAPEDFAPPPPIAAVAVFDTVSSLGMPQTSPDGQPAFDFSLCDDSLSTSVQHGFHALAADEMRDIFSPTLWAPREGVVQAVFPGCHSDVGGGFRNRGLSDGALAWMLDRLDAIGVRLDRSRITPALQPDPLAAAQDDGATFPFNLTPQKARSFPDHVILSEALTTRLGRPVEMFPTPKPAPYRPRALRTDGKPLATGD